MTDAQARQIQEMRMKGSGYKAIGAAIGLSRDIVRNYCKKHNLAGYAAVVSKNMKLMVDGKEVCHFCGNAITQPRDWKAETLLLRKMQEGMVEGAPGGNEKSEFASYELTCQHCGKTFISYGNRNRKYCSRECYIQYRFLKEDEDEYSNV